MVDRRSYLKFGGGALAAGLTGGVIAFVARNGDETTAFEEYEIDYEEYDEPEEIYHIWTGEPSRFSFVDNATYTGDTALRCEIPTGESDGSNAMYRFPSNGFDQPHEIYQRTMIALGEDWTMDDGDVCRIWCAGLNTEAGTKGSGGRGRPAGDDGWSSMFAVTDRNTSSDTVYNLGAYTYHMDQPSTSGEFEVIDAPVPVGKWIQLETEVRMNTVTDGAADRNGEVRCWLNGDLVYERADFRWTTTTSQAVEYAGPLVRYGGGETAPTDLAIYYDDHELRSSELDEVIHERESFVEDPARIDAYDGRITIAAGEDGLTYRLYVDGYIAHTQWSNVDGHETAPNETVEIALSDDGYMVVDAIADPNSADAYLFDGEFLAMQTDTEPAELWVSGTELEPDDVPSVPDA